MMRPLLATLCLAAALGLGAPARASTFEPVVLPQLVADASDGVVQGKVLAVHSAWNDDQTAIFSWVELEVTRSFSGGYAMGTRLTIKEVGGTVDDYTVAAIGFPHFRVGDEVVAFLTRWEDDGELRVQHMAQGFYQVVTAKGLEVLVPGPTQDAPDREGVITTPIPRGTTVVALANRLGTN